MTRSSKFLLRAFLAAAPKSNVPAPRPTGAASRITRLLFTSILLPGLCLAQQDVQQQRQEILKGLLTGPRPEKAAQQRWICISGDEPSSVKEARAMGFDFTPDASDSCLAALQRAAKDRTLTEPTKSCLPKPAAMLRFQGFFPR